MKKTHSENILSALRRIKDLGGLELCEKEIQKLSQLKVLVIGEPIIDTYRFCRPESISSKSPSISARFEMEENYQGGASAIARHLNDFVKDGIFLHPADFPEVRKIRYIASDRQQRIFEITHLPDDSYRHTDASAFCDDVVSMANRSDLVIIADFGHRLFEGEVLSCLNGISSFVALNVQTNSSNYGFNVFKKHPRFDYLSLDLREARLAYHDRNSTVESITQKIKADLWAKPFSLTLGREGACFYSDLPFHCPALVSSVVDATGAGDAYFALTSCLVRTGCTPELIPFLGNAFAGLKTKIIGNKSAVPQALLMKTLAKLLK